MKIVPKSSISLVPRAPHWIQNRQNYYTMERNERVDEFDKKTLSNILKKISSYGLRTYPDEMENFYKLMSKWLKVKKEEIIMTNGADGGLLTIFNVFADVGDEIIYLNPSYAMYPLYCKMFKTKPKPLNIDLNFTNKVYFQKLIQHIKKNKPRIVAVANPNQPIETFLTEDQVKKIAILTLKKNCYLVVDEAYFHFNKISAIKLIKRFKNIIVVRTFSKAFGLAGLRVGYVVSNKDVIDLLKSIKPIYELNNVNLKICEYFLKNLKIMKDYVNEVNKSKKYIYKNLDKKKINIFGKLSNTFLIKFNNENDTKKIFDKLLKKKILVRIMNISGKKNYIRCTLGSLRTTKILTEVINRNL